MPYPQEFPTALDAFPDPLGTDPLSLSNSLRHSEYHEMHSSALEALQVKVGIDGSADTSSLDYLVASLGVRATRLETQVDPWRPTGVIGTTISRDLVTTASLAALQSGFMRLDGIRFLKSGVTINNIAYWSGSTAMSGPSNWWFALYGYHATAPIFLGQSADQTTAPWAANEKKLLALSTPVVIPSDGLYYTACMVNATTVPTLRGTSSSIQFINEELPVRGGQTTTGGLTTTAPSPATAIATKEEILCYAQVS